MLGFSTEGPLHRLFKSLVAPRSYHVLDGGDRDAERVIVAGFSRQDVPEVLGTGARSALIVADEVLVVFLIHQPQEEIQQHGDEAKRREGEDRFLDVIPELGNERARLRLGVRQMMKMEEALERQQGLGSRACEIGPEQTPHKFFVEPEDDAVDGLS